MSSTTVISGHLARGSNRYFAYRNGLATTKAYDDEVQLRWDLTDELASGETVSSAAYADHGVVTSGKSVSSPVIICTVARLGYTIITATLSTGRTLERTWYYLEPENPLRRRDYRVVGW